MRSPVDALRSMKRYASEVLGAEWEVRLWADDVKSEQPLARVAVTGQVAYSGPAIYADAVMPMAVYCYPVPVESVQVGLVNAMTVENVLFTGFRKGVANGRSARIPLYDYDGVPVEGIDSGSNVRYAHDYMRVTDLQIGHIHDPTDDRFIVVTADVRVTWRRATHADPGNTVQSVITEVHPV